MEEFVEIGAHVAKGVGDGVYEKIYKLDGVEYVILESCLLYTSPSPRDRTRSRMPSSA